MKNKYTQTSKRWGTYKFAGNEIGMTPNIARNKEARLAYIMGHLAAKSNEELQRYEAKREKFDLPLRPFNAGWRNNHLNKNYTLKRRNPTLSDPSYRCGEDKLSLFETMNDDTKNWHLVSEFYEELNEHTH